RSWCAVPGSPDSDDEAAHLVESLAIACEARPVRLGAAEHDAAVAAISHLPLVLAAALVEAVSGPADGPERADWPLARSLAASGWRDMTRLAEGDPEMAAGILATNGGPIVERLRAVRAVIEADHPVPRPARRARLLPDAAHPRGSGPQASRPLFDRRRRPHQSRRRRPPGRAAQGVAGGARGGFRARIPARRPAQRRRD